MTPDERARFIQDVAQAVPVIPTLTDEERRWVQMAIKREAQSFAFRQAVIEKTVTALIWFLLMGAGYLVADFLRNHGLKI